MFMKCKVKIMCLLCCNIFLFLSVGCTKEYNETAAEIQTAARTEVISEETEISEQIITETSTARKETTTAPNIETTVPYTEIETTAFSTTTMPISVMSQNTMSAPYAGLYNAQTMECLYSQESTVRIYPASLTKILTACTALKYVSADTIFTVGTEQSIVPKGSSLCLIKPGHRLKLRDLLTGMLMRSGNDAAYTVAVGVAREVAGNKDMNDAEAVSYFAELMNDYARELGAVNSNFTNPDGWDNENQYSTVYDLALISAHAVQTEEIRSIVSSRSKRVVFASGEIAKWKNTNLLLQPDNRFYLPEAIGLKTGTTAKAGNCLIAVVRIDNTQYIAVVTGCKSDSERYESVHNLIKKIK